MQNLIALSGDSYQDINKEGTALHAQFQNILVKIEDVAGKKAQQDFAKAVAKVNDKTQSLQASSPASVPNPLDIDDFFRQEHSRDELDSVAEQIALDLYEKNKAAYSTMEMNVSGLNKHAEDFNNLNKTILTDLLTSKSSMEALNKQAVYARVGALMIQKGDFDSALAINAAFENVAFERTKLQGEADKATAKDLSRLKSTFSVEKNQRNLKKAMKNHKGLILMPISSKLGHMEFASGNSEFYQATGKFNDFKMELMARIVSELAESQKFINTTGGVEPHAMTTNFTSKIDNDVKLDDDARYECSEAILPRGTKTLDLEMFSKTSEQRDAILETKRAKSAPAALESVPEASVVEQAPSIQRKRSVTMPSINMGELDRQKDVIAADRAEIPKRERQSAQPDQQPSQTTIKPLNMAELERQKEAIAADRAEIPKRERQPAQPDQQPSQTTIKPLNMAELERQKEAIAADRAEIPKRERQSAQPDQQPSQTTIKPLNMAELERQKEAIAADRATVPRRERNNRPLKVAKAMDRREVKSQQRKSAPKREMDATLFAELQQARQARQTQTFSQPTISASSGKTNPAAQRQPERKADGVATQTTSAERQQAAAPESVIPERSQDFKSLFSLFESSAKKQEQSARSKQEEKSDASAKKKGPRI